MKKFPSKLVLTMVPIFLLSTFVFAEEQDIWQYSKEVSYENKEGLKAIYLDEEIYRHANQDLSDIRLINEKKEFIPYYIYNSFTRTNKAEQVEYTSKKVLSYTKENNYYVDYEINLLHENQDVIGNALILHVSQDTFYKEVQILGSYDNKSWENIKKDMIYHVNGQEKTQVLLGDNYKYSYYRIISLNDITGIPINSLSLVYDQSESVYETYKKSKPTDYNVEINKETKETILKIDNKDRLRVNAITIKADGDFNRNYRLDSISEKGEVLGQVAAGFIYRFNLEGLEIQDTTILVEETIDGFLAPEHFQIRIQDKDDQPIQIKAIEISYYVDKIVFKTNDKAGLQLLFGNKAALKPQYDMSTYITEMEKAKQETVVLLDLAKRDIEELPQGKALNVKWILNMSVIVTSGLLIALILRKR